MVLTCLRLLSYHFSDGFQAFSIIFAKFIIVYGVFDTFFTSSLYVRLLYAVRVYKVYRVRVRFSCQGPLPPLRGTFSGDATGIPRFAPVRGAAPHAKTHSQALFFPASSRTSSAPSGHLPRARGRLRALQGLQVLPKGSSQKPSPLGKGDRDSGG